MFRLRSIAIFMVQSLKAAAICGGAFLFMCWCSLFVIQLTVLLSCLLTCDLSHRPEIAEGFESFVDVTTNICN
jgi:hypothetical protein